MLSSFTNKVSLFPIQVCSHSGGVKAGRGVKTINWDDYKQVKEFLHLKD